MSNPVIIISNVIFTTTNDPPAIVCKGISNVTNASGEYGNCIDAAALTRFPDITASAI